MTTTNISHPEPLKEFVDEQVQRRGYGGASEYVRELIRAAQRQATVSALEEKILQGIASGKATPMTNADWEKLRRNLRESAGDSTR
jgi:antitoxin ParD1/3/4